MEKKSKMTDKLWSEEYRPKTIEDCILPPALKQSFQEIVKSKSIPNMLLSGTSGLGKTTVARALCNELDADYILINGSEDSGIDVLRTKIRQFASTRSLMDSVSNQKVVILDEADYLNANSTQPALRGFIEEFNEVCRFIFTCNFRNRIIDALQSRCTCIDFTTDGKAKADLCSKFYKRMANILTENEIEFEPKVLGEIIVRFAPDWRRVLNECQRFSGTGKLSSEVLASLSDENIGELIKALRDKNFKVMRNWVANNVDLDSSVIFRRVYDILTDITEPQSIPAAVLIIGEYQYRASMVADREINIVACCTELMRDCVWK
jgi:DNA polymerase III delta prime subunit